MYAVRARLELSVLGTVYNEKKYEQTGDGKMLTESESKFTINDGESVIRTERI